MVVKTNQKESLKDLILIKREKSSISFNEHFLNSFHENDLKNLALKSSTFSNLLSKKNMEFFFFAMASIPFIMFPGFLLNPIILFLLPISLFSVCIGDTKWFKNKILKKWIMNKKNVDELKDIYFEETVADKSVLKEFALMYGEEALVNLLEEKDVVKYKEIIKSISEEERRNLKTEKRENLIKAVKCMTNE